jgi:hypothetical protein
MALNLAQNGLAPGVEEAWEDIERFIERRFQLDAARRGTLAR